MSAWVAEAREPDGSWVVLFSEPDVKVVLRFLRRWKRDRGHLVPETRVRRP